MFTFIYMNCSCTHKPLLPHINKEKKKKNPKERNVMHLALTTIVVMQASVNPVIATDVSKYLMSRDFILKLQIKTEMVLYIDIYLLFPSPLLL